MTDADRKAFIAAAIEFQELSAQHYAKARLARGLRGAGAARDIHRLRGARWHQRRGARFSFDAQTCLNVLIDGH